MYENRNFKEENIKVMVRDTSLNRSVLAFDSRKECVDYAKGILKINPNPSEHIIFIRQGDFILFNALDAMRVMSWNDIISYF